MDYIKVDGMLVPAVVPAKMPSPDADDYTGKYGEQYRDWLELYNGFEFDRMVRDCTLWDSCREKDAEVQQFVDDTIQALLANDPAPDQQTDPIGWVAHMNSLQEEAEEMAEPLMFGGKYRAELGDPLFHAAAIPGTRKNIFYQGTDEEWDKDMLGIFCI